MTEPTNREVLLESQLAEAQAEVVKLRAALIDTIEAQLANEPPSFFGQLMVADLLERQIVRCRFCRKPLHKVNDDWRDAEWLTWCSQDRRHEPEVRHG